MSLATPRYRRKLLKFKAHFGRPQVSRSNLHLLDNASDQDSSGLEATLHSPATALWVQPVIDTVTSSVVKLSVVRPGSTTLKDWQILDLQGICGVVKRFELPCVTLLCTPPDFRSPQLLSVLETSLMTSGLSPKTLEIAIPESFFVDLCSEAQHTIAVLRDWGVNLAVYNFGARIAPLSCLESADIASIMLAPDIAERLIAPLKNPHYPLAVVRAVNEAASLLDIGVVATGVRSLEQCERLKSLGCHLQQGHFFVAPGRVDKLDIWGKLLPHQEGLGTGRVRN